MATTTEKLILELQARIEKYNRDILDATKKTVTFQKVTAKAFTSIERDAKRVDKSLSSFAKGVKKSFDNVGKNVGKGGKSLTDFSAKAKKSLASVQKDSNKAAKAVDKLSASVKKVPKKIGVRVDLKVKKIRDGNDALATMDKRAKQASGSLFKFSNVAKGVFAAIGARAFVNFADSITLADNQLRNVTANAEQFNFVQMELNRIARETRQDVNVLTGVFAKFTRAGQEAGFSQQELLDFTENLTKSFKLEGNTVAEVNSVLGQLVQSFRKGKIDGEEFRALSEGSTLALQALAKQLGVTIGELKDLGAQGKIAARDLVEGMKGIEQQVDTEFATLGTTFSELGTKLGNLLAKGFRESGTQDVLQNFAKEMSAGIDAIEFTFTDLGKKTFTQFKLIEKIGVDAVGRIVRKSEEIGEIRARFKIETDTTEIDKLKDRFSVLVKEIKSEGEDAGFFDNLTETTKTLISDFSLLISNAKAAQLLSPKAAVKEVDDKRKPLVTFDAGDDKIVEQGVRRLTLLENQAEQERQLLEAVEEDRVSAIDSAAIARNQKEIERIDEGFLRTLERLGTNQEQVDELLAIFAEGTLQKLTNDELALIDLAQRASDAKLAIVAKEVAKTKKIRDIARKNELATTLGTGGRILAAISGLSKKGTEVQKNAARASIIFNTAAGIVRQFKDTPFQKALPQAIAVGLEGAAALASIGGGGGGGPVSGGGAGTDIDSEEPGQTEQTVNITDITGGEIARETIQIVISDESGNTFVDTLGTRIKSAESDGRI